MVSKEIRIIFPPILITAFLIKTGKIVNIVCGSVVVVVTSFFAAISGLLSGITVVLIVDSGSTVVVTTSVVVVSEQFLVVIFHLSPYIYFSKQFLALSNLWQSVITVSITSILAIDHFWSGGSLVLALVLGVIVLDCVVDAVVAVDVVNPDVVVGKLSKNASIWRSSAEETPSPSSFIFPSLHSFRRIWLWGFLYSWTDYSL